jgi:hypothetical protein
MGDNLKTGRRKRKPLTRHSRIKRIRSAKEKISSLYSAWDDLDPITRAERLLELTKLGCSVRGLAGDLAVSPTNLRFHLELNELKPSEKDAVKAGASPKHALLVLQQRLETQARIERIRQERATGAISDQFARDIALFLTTEHIWSGDEDSIPKKASIGDDYIERFFSEVRWIFEVRFMRPPSIDPAVLRSRDFKVICKAVRPDQNQYEFWFSWLADWLVLALAAAAPEIPIREAVLETAPAALTSMLRGPKKGTSPSS